ncbi:hypothetical protein niasHT_014239 [Heterodera trifolii]|uniref:Calmodulin-binding domain-containing protein n=1 Tax=Heterodera trifolii TaxID=157864 RepID=A0ABD2KX53_9BILA
MPLTGMSTIVEEEIVPLLEAKMPSVPFIKLSNNVELPSLTVVPLLNLDYKQKLEIFRAAIIAGYTHIDMSNIGIYSCWSLISEIRDQIDQLGSDRKNFFVTIKLIVDHNKIQEKFAKIMNIFQTDYVNLLMVGFTDCGPKQRQEKKAINNNTLPTAGLMEDHRLEQGTTTIKPVDVLMNAWSVAEQLYNDGKVKTLGVSRTDIEMVKQLCERAKTRPHCWQIDLAPLMANFDDVLALCSHHKVVPIVRANAMGASSKFGSHQQRGFYHTLLREMANKYGKSATQVLCRWLFQHGMAVVCSCGPSTRIGQQTNIFDFRISNEDMRRLNSLYNRNVITRPYQLPQQNKTSTSERIRHLAYARRHSAELALALSLLGTMFMVLAMEFGMAKWQKMDEAMRWTLAVTTVTLLLVTVRYHVLQAKYRMHVNSIKRWNCAVHLRQRVLILLELVLCAVVPLPLLRLPCGGDAFACALMFLRLYWLPRVLHLRSRLSTDAAAKSIAGLNCVKTDTRFLLKRMLFLHPGPTLSAFVFCFWLIGAYILRLCESNDEMDVLSYYNTLWMMCVTFLTIGYGDIYPMTACGRIMAIVTGIVGVCVASMIVAVIVQKISLSQAEERVHKFMAKTKFSKKLKVTAARVLTESWFVYKNRQNPDKLKYHQCRQSAAIYALRKLRKEQRMFHAEDNCTSIDEVARTTTNMFELVRTQGCLQQSVNDRLNSLEQQLNDIQKGIDGLIKSIPKSH